MAPRPPKKNVAHEMDSGQAKPRHSVLRGLLESCSPESHFAHGGSCGPLPKPDQIVATGRFSGQNLATPSIFSEHNFAVCIGRKLNSQYVSQISVALIDAATE